MNERPGCKFIPIIGQETVNAQAYDSYTGGYK
jgi:hypothetical protein